MLWVVSLQTAGKAVSMALSRKPQRIASVLAPLSAALRSCPQGRHFRLLCWLWVSLLLCQGPATLQQLARARPRRLHDWSLLPLLRAGYWEAADLWAEWARAVLTTLPPPAAGRLYLIVAPTLRGKTGQQQPWAHHTRRLNQPEPFVFGPSVLLVLAPWGRLRIPSRWVPSCWLRGARVNRTSSYAVCCGSSSRRAGADAWWCSLMPALPARPTGGPSSAATGATSSACRAPGNWPTARAGATWPVTGPRAAIIVWLPPRPTGAAGITGSI